MSEGFDHQELQSTFSATAAASGATTGSPAVPAKNPFFSNSKVLLLADDVAGRCFSFWVNRSVELGAGVAPFYVDEMMYNEENLDKTIASLCADVMSMGAGLSNLNKADFKQAIEDLAVRFEDVLPRNETIKFIMNECPALMSVQSWAEIFDFHLACTDA
ncbi:hypothetical protein HDU98_007476 [Podochytrium sp. JEL0797]|nr:hypothetical protein HDU98_007476 [Podochytrium sp. JEL0797]